MIRGMPIIGARFDIAKVGAGQQWHAGTSWRIVWEAIDPSQICGALLYDGDTAATLKGRENVFCIAFQSADPKFVATIKSALSESQAFRENCAVPMFAEGSACAAEPLPGAGRIDAAGNLVGEEADAARTALGDLRREQRARGATAEEIQIPARAKPASEQTRSLPTLASFGDLRAFIETTFTPLEYPKDCGCNYWMTPEELCDIVDHYTHLVAVQYLEYSCGTTEDMCCVRLFTKELAERCPIEFRGLFSFPSLQEARAIAKGWSTPAYANALPRLADVRGRFQFNFCKGAERAQSDPNKGVSPQELWQKLYVRKQGFLSQLAQGEERAKPRAEGQHTTHPAATTPISVRGAAIPGSTEADPNVPTLVLLAGDGTEGSATPILTNGTTFVGSAVGGVSGLCVQGDGVANTHCRIETDGQVYSIVNQASAGTSVNGTKVTRSPLQDGDIIIIGAVRMRFTCGASQKEKPSTEVKTSAASFDPVGWLKQVRETAEAHEAKPATETMAKRAVSEALLMAMRGASSEDLKAHLMSSDKKPHQVSFERYSGSGVCDVCNKDIGSCEAYRVPVNVFYSSKKYKEWLTHGPLSSMIQIGGGVESYIAHMRLSDTTSHSAVCSECVHMFP